jgi:NADPH:quinone reductase-like Zn-dependent oxidoreductase
MLKLVEEKKIKPVVDHTYQMSDVVSAAERLAGSGQFGKVVLRIA